MPIPTEVRTDARRLDPLSHQETTVSAPFRDHLKIGVMTACAECHEKNDRSGGAKF